ncbi:ATP-binding protein [Roseibacillus ishigakijimensis]|uniref:histidine kinase n=1 Tax=Roseibacillus ishigakijimensis TaxID=454146 RepID=A0A934RL09_9BACT|nr:ATP-binding protein [Roseibacillus ishigakijimensis]MBK1833354.1 response regulator [Roseibacillus ishigakijimensis]
MAASNQFGSWTYSLQYDELFLSSFWREMAGYEEGEGPVGEGGLLFQQIVHPEDQQRVLTGVRTRLESSEAGFELFLRLRHSSGEWVWFSIKGETLDCDSEGRPLALRGSYGPIRTRQRMNAAGEVPPALFEAACEVGRAICRARGLREAFQVVCELLVEKAGFRMAWGTELKPGDRFLQPQVWAGSNEGFAERLQLSIDDVALGKGPIGMSYRSKQIYVCRDVWSEPIFRPWREIAMRQGYVSCAAVPLVARSDEVMGVLGLYYPERDGIGEEEVQLLQAVSANLALAIESSRREESLRESKNQFTELAGNIGEGVFSYCCVTRKLLYVNPVYWTLLGLPECDVTYEVLLQRIYPQDVGLYLRLIEKRLAGEETNEEYRVVHDGGEVVWINEHTISITDDAGRVIKINGVLRDITNHKKMEAQLLRTQRMESLGTMAGGIAHDLNNVLAPISLSIDLLRYTGDEQRRTEILDMIKSSAERGANLVKQVLLFARGAEGKREQVSLLPLLKEILKFVDETFPKDISVFSHLEEGLWEVNGDPTHLHQVLMNLCVNARDAMPKGGKLSLRARNVSLAQDQADRLGALAAGKYVELTVSDNGTGMSRELIERIFEPFYSTKEVGRGTGLGLSTSLAIVRGHGGAIEVESELGRGSSFRVFLPRVKLAEHPAPERAQPALPAGRGETVMIVDDEDMVRDLLHKTLESRGYQVVAAVDGVDAIEKLKSRTKVDVLITDMMMPRMGGRELINWLKRERPELKVIATSGLGGEELGRGGEERGVVRFISKPYNRTQLFEVLDEVLHPGD